MFYSFYICNVYKVYNERSQSSYKFYLLKISRANNYNMIFYNLLVEIYIPNNYKIMTRQLYFFKFPRPNNYTIRIL